MLELINSLFSLKINAAATAAKSLQSCPTLCDPIDGRPAGFPIPGILQARTLEWVAMAFSNAWKGKGKGKLLSCVRLFLTPWTAAYQAPPPMGSSRQEDWSGLPLPSPKINATLEHFLRGWQVTVSMIIKLYHKVLSKVLSSPFFRPGSVNIN